MDIGPNGAFAPQACTGLTQDTGMMVMMMTMVTKDMIYMSKLRDSYSIYVWEMRWQIE